MNSSEGKKDIDILTVKNEKTSAWQWDWLNESQYINPIEYKQQQLFLNDVLTHMFKML